MPVPTQSPSPDDAERFALSSFSNSSIQTLIITGPLLWTKILFRSKELILLDKNCSHRLLIDETKFLLREDLMFMLVAEGAIGAIDQIASYHTQMHPRMNL
jgi:hypothetical protein